MSSPTPSSSPHIRSLPGFLGLNVSHSSSLVDVFGTSQRYGNDGADPEQSGPHYSRVSVIFDTAAIQADTMATIERVQRYFDRHGVIRLGNHISSRGGRNTPRTTTISVATDYRDIEVVRGIVEAIEADGLASQQQSGPGGTGAPPAPPGP